MLAAGSVAFLAGILLLHRLPALPPPGALAGVAGLAAVAAAGAAALALRGRRVPAAALALPAVAAAGFAWDLADALAGRARVLDPALEGRELVVEGTVAGLPEQRPAGVRFRFRPARVVDARTGAVVEPPGDLRLVWFGRPPRLVPGERWRLRVRLRRPAGLFNPGGFRYEDWLHRHRYAGTGYVRGGGHRLAPARGHHADRLRLHLRERLRAALAREGTPLAGPLTALALGDRSAMTPEQWAVLRATGTGHLMAISGLHVGLVAGMALAACAGLWRRVPWLARRWPARLPASLAGLAAGAGYAALAGFSVPTRRALVMLAVGLAVLATGRGRSAAHALGLALLAVLLLDPRAVLDPGLWLSFGAVALILLAAAPRPAPPRAVALVRVQWALALGLAPLTLAGFQQASLAGLGVNLVAIPWTGLAVVPPLLAGTLALGLGLPGGTALAGLAAAALETLWRLLEWAAALPGAQWLAPAPPLVAVALAVAAGVFALLPRALPGRALWPLLLLPLLAFRPPRPPPGEAWITALDVGQGLAAVVRTHAHALLYDTGARMGQLDTGAAAVVPFLRRAGVGALDVLVLSHGDLDHRGGLTAVRAALPVRRLLTGAPARVPEGEPCRAGTAWTWDGVRFEILHPRRPRRGNDGSCVLRVSAGGTVALLPGDLEARGERLLLAAGGDLRADLLLSPHHGSAGASTPPFVRAVRPRWVVHAAGRRNRYRFPRPATVARYGALGARQLVTGTTGAVRFVLSPQGLRGPWCARDAGRRFWHRTGGCGERH